jgi:hypothetical protein
MAAADNAEAIPPKRKLKEVEWLALAINHPAGNIALFWLTWLGRQRKTRVTHGKEFQSLPVGSLHPFCRNQSMPENSVSCATGSRNISQDWFLQVPSIQ